ncbi:hypothetical protein DTO207G8_2472 [Paecilomyces variotii]|nr:hypothetical protein DTO032I3_7760 [Paecilomyces variotii]KAJ9256869.1 hypothetical protein DTO207G8_2472 [Paecilomyces variotii]KAJ9279035.1 hypothetical protein DTO021D3_4072 [Paecilomyces variotii]KAJ9288727.1 hypothetical protein DTO021C3_3756 [Paecilomyces variotii]KAJ9344333.1 hypothetical protein DTO027B6_2951 [Paecilomyces variotii]
MRYDLSQQEHSALSQRLREIPSQPINLDNDELRVHGRSWTKEHMDALRVAHLDNLPLDRFFPPDYIPGDTDPVFSSLAAEVTQLKEDDIRSFSVQKFSTTSGGFLDLFERLDRAVATSPAIIPGQVNSASCEDLSSSGDESTALSCLILLLFGIMRKPSLRKVVPGWEFTVGRIKSCRIWLGTSGKVKAPNDEPITLRTWDSVTRESMISQIPLVSLEAKARRPGDPDPFNWDTFAQEVAKLLGQAMASCKEMHGGWKDQDAWLISIHGTEVRLVTARFKEGYLRQVNSSMVARTEYLVVFRSRPFDIITDEGRVQAVRAIIALLRWIKSGNSLQSTIQGVLNAARSGT